jgi:N-acyl-D-amino-acid deacylase
MKLFPSILKKFPLLTLALIVLVTASVVFLLLNRLTRPTPNCDGEFDLVITGAEIIDGSGRSSFSGDLGIRERRIACIGDLHGAKTRSVIDATGLTVAPGFIDVHTHIERNVPQNGGFQAPNFVRQGVTTVITGNCGRSVLEIGKFFRRLEANGSQVNVASLVGHNTIRSHVMKQRSAAPSKAEMTELEKLVEQAMQDGALGMSTGLVYVPGTFAKTDEISKLAQIVANEKGIYVSHLRDEGSKGREALEEALFIGQETGVPVHISHFKAQGPNEWGSAESRLNLIRSANDRGMVVSLDQYPYTASSTGLAVLLPAWLSEGDLGSAKRKLQDPATRKRVRNEMLAQLKRNGWKNYAFARIAYYQFDQSLVGLNIAEITQKRTGRTLSARAAVIRPAFATSNVADYGDELDRQAETVIDLFSHGGAQMVFFDMSEADVEFIMKDRQVMFGSDSSVREENPAVLPHPRGMGTFPRVLGVYAREKSLFSLEEAVRRMTSLPATTFALKDRGLVKENYWADLVIFGRNRILDTATFEKPFSFPVGVDYVIVNGSVVLDHHQFSKSLPGGAIRREQPPPSEPVDSKRMKPGSQAERDARSESIRRASGL